jgi:hypothetical protein
LGQRSRKRGQRQRPPARREATAATPQAAAPPAPARATASARATDSSRSTASARSTDPTRRGRSEARDAAVRAKLKPLAPGERPWPITVGAILAALSGGLQLALYVFGVKLSVAGTHAKAGSTILFGVLMFVCAIGMWLRKYWAVLGFMAILGITVSFFALALIKASSLLGFVIAIAGVLIGGGLFYKLVRVLSRIQMPEYPGR